MDAPDRSSVIFNDKFYLLFFVATRGFRESGLCIYPRSKVGPMFFCVYISTPLKSCPYKSSAAGASAMVSR